jgi:prepilin-type N-terminal cleavage/methylation domain-containing protein
MSRSRQKGFTLIELVTTIGIIAIISSALAVFVVDNYRFQSRTLSQGQSFGEAQRAIDRMKREIRGATRGANGAFPIANATADSLTIYADYDYDGHIEQVRYFVSDGTFYRGIIEPQATEDIYPPDTETTSIISANIANDSTPIFSYYTDTYSGSEPAMNPVIAPNIRIIRIYLIIDTSPNINSGRYIIDTLVNLRNLKII